MQVEPELRDKMVSSATPVFFLLNTEEDLRLWSASSNICAVLESRMLLLLVRGYNHKGVRNISDTYLIHLSCCYGLLELLDKGLDFVALEVVHIGSRVYSIMSQTNRLLTL